jgi:hypothetical protein
MKMPAAALWPNGPICHHCGNSNGERIRKLAGKTTRRGLYKCYECGKPVRVGNIFESSHLPLHLWLQEGHFDPPNSADARLQHENG